jgi:protein subunit release factor B
MPKPHEIVIPLAEIEYTAIRAQQIDRQKVNKWLNAVHLRLDIRTSSLSAIHGHPDRHVDSFRRQ